MKIFIIIACMLAGSFTLGKGSEGVGGGNTLNGKPIESYMGDITTYASYKNVVQAILANIDSKVPNYSNQLRKAITEKIWYFVPVRLKKLPIQITGVHFESDQTIIQRERSVWVDSDGFDSLNEREQSILILHELVMGVVLKQKDYKIIPTDSDFVRDMTVYLLMNSNGSALALQQKLEKQYEYSIPMFIAPLFYSWLVTSQNPMERLFTFLQNLKSSSKLPNGTKGKCETSLNYDSQSRSITVSTSYRQSEDSSSVATEGPPSAISITSNQFSHLSPLELFTEGGAYGKVIGNLKYNFVEGDAQAEEGLIRRALTMSVNGLLGIYELNIQYLICRSKLSANHCVWDQPSPEELHSQNFSSVDQRFCSGIN